MYLFIFPCVGKTELLQQIEDSGKVFRNELTDPIAPAAVDSIAAGVAKGVYFSQEKPISVSAQDAVYTKALEKMPVASFLSALDGRLAGLVVHRSSGQPGNEGVSVTLRGRVPIIVIDGIVRNLTVMDLEGIESVTVLKDAIAVAMLGVRGANGAVLVTTRKGHEGHQEITFNAQTSLQQPLSSLLSDPLRAYDYGVLYNEAQYNDDRFLLNPRNIAYTPEALDAYRTGADPSAFPDVNWRDELLRKRSRFDRYTFTASGGNEWARYFVSAEHFNQQGLFKTHDWNQYDTDTDYKSYSVRSNVDLRITSRLEGGISLLGRLLRTNNPGNNLTANIFSGILTTPNNAYPVFNPDGSFGGNRQYPNNLLAQSIHSGYSVNTKRDIMTDFYLKRNLDDVLPGLWIKARASFTSHVSENIVRNKSFAVFQRSVAPSGAESYTQFGTIGTQANSNNVDAQNRMDYQEFSVGYKRTFSRKHGLSLLALANRDNIVSGSNLPLTYKGISGHFAYDYDEKYLLEVGFGYNGSNWFPEKGDTRYAFLPSIGAGWVLSKERFARNLKGVDELKLRASYGLTGWDAAAYFAYVTRYGLGPNVNFGTAAGSLNTIREMAIGNPSIGYEKAAKLNIGIDTRLFSNQLSVSLDYYQDRHSGILMEKGLNTTILGQAYPLENIGKYDFSGGEAVVSWQKSFANSLSFFLTSNIAMQDSRVRYIAEVYQPHPWMERTGQRPGQLFGYTAEGLFLTDAEAMESPVMEGYSAQAGDIRYKDLNGDQVINQLDQSPIGLQRPAIHYGLTAGIEFHGIDFSFLVQGAGNRQLLLSGNSFYEFQNAGTGQAYTHHLDRWTPEHPEASYPRLSLGHNINNHVASTYWLKSGSYLRLRHAELGYSLPAAVSRSVKLESIRFFLSATNILTFKSKELGNADPELFSGQYPLQQLITLGAKIKL